MTTAFTFTGADPERHRSARAATFVVCVFWITASAGCASGPRHHDVLTSSDATLTYVSCDVDESQLRIPIAANAVCAYQLDNQVLWIASTPKDEELLFQDGQRLSLGSLFRRRRTTTSMYDAPTVVLTPLGTGITCLSMAVAIPSMLERQYAIDRSEARSSQTQQIISRLARDGESDIAIYIISPKRALFRGTLQLTPGTVQRFRTLIAGMDGDGEW